jgi:N-methylhydantoinase A
MGTYRLGVDIGSTFTDLMLVDDGTGRPSMLKVPTTPRDPAAAVRQGIQALLAAERLPFSEISIFVHGTTLALNTVIERSGARVGLIVTQGYRDLLELRRLRLRIPQDFNADRPDPLVPRRLVREVQERMLADGSVYVPLDPDQVRAAVGDLEAHGCTAFAICFLHAYANGAHERMARTVIEQTCPKAYVCTSHEVWPQRREYERCLATVVNAYVGSRLTSYFTRLESELRRLGLTAPVLSTKSNGGMMTARTAGERPIETVFSGPAAGVIGASYLARMIGEEHVITLDMGGTSADVSVMNGGYTFSTDANAGDFPIILPAIDISSIGAGGGSIAWADAMRVLKVGPRSAGASPGPACYGQGGTEPTVTDAYVTLGIIDPNWFLGGTMTLTKDLAVDALAKLGHELGQTAQELAWNVLEVATAKMLAQFAPLMARHGVDPRDYAILAYGGAGPTHAFLLAREAGAKKVIIPPLPGGLCALGCLVADLRADFVHTWNQKLAPTSAAGLASAFQDLESQAHRWIAAEDFPVVAVRYERAAEMRYTGQSFELSVPLDQIEIDDILARFQARYHAVYGHVDPDAPVEVVDIRVQVVGETVKPRIEIPTREDNSALIGDRRILFEGAPMRVPVFDRKRLSADAAFSGPAIVEQYDSTTFVPPGFDVRIDRRNNLIGEAE